jgi:BarA-like signal transduction histidine kinase
MENTTMKIPDKDGQFEWTLTYTVINRKKKPGITVELIDLTKEELAQESESDTVVEGDVPNTEIQDIQEDEVAADAVRTDEEPVEELAPEANLAEELAEAQVDVILLNVPPDFTHALAFNEDVYDTGAELADMAKKVAIALAGQASLAVDGISVRSVSLLWSDDHTYTPTLAVLLTTQASAVMTFAYTPSCPTTVMWTQGESSTIMSKSQALYDYVVSFELSEGIVEDGYYETASGSAPISLLDDNEWGLFKNTMFNGLSKWNAR